MPRVQEGKDLPLALQYEPASHAQAERDSGLETISSRSLGEAPAGGIGQGLYRCCAHAVDRQAVARFSLYDL